MSDDRAERQHEYDLRDHDSVNWWSWRPGIKPRKAMVIGGLITLFALLLIGIGLITLALGVLDGFSPPLQIAGVVAGHSMNNFDGLPHLNIRMHTPGFPSSVSPVVSNAAYQTLSDGEHVKADDPLGSIALLFLGVVFLPYPALLALWSWRDLHPTRASGDGRCTMTAKVVGKRAAVRTVARRGTNRPGLLPQFSRSWY